MQPFAKGEKFLVSTHFNAACSYKKLCYSDPMKPKEKHILETFKHMLEQRVHLNTFALFGSRARGDAGRYSDMDVLVVVDQLDTLTADYISDCAWESGFESGIVIVPVSYSKSEWEGIESQSLLAANIRAEGIFL
jgi:uncharacterized protein